MFRDFVGRVDGAGNRNRTYDLRITNAPLYQLSYSGKAAHFIDCSRFAPVAWCKRGSASANDTGPVRHLPSIWSPLGEPFHPASLRYPASYTLRSASEG